MTSVLDQFVGSNFTAINADCIEVTAALPESSLDLVIYSPPFASLFVYSASERDMGNVQDYDTFGETYRHLARSLFNAVKPGRICAVHCSDLPTSQTKDGVIGLFDLPAVIRETHQAEGWVYHSRVTIWKDPVVEMQRTKAHGLLYKTFRTDSSRCRTGLPDYMLIFRKPVDGPTSKTPDPVQHDRGRHPVMRWQEIASPVWMTINQTNVLNVKVARDDKDERHLCPLQLDVIERCVELYTNPGDTVYSPFMGIGSEGYQALKMGRRFIGTELKPAYYHQAVKNLMEAERIGGAGDLFAVA